ncbi:MAG: NAD(P)-dependent malic enzyme [Candidatus Njordarchaeales archaeon]
MVGEKKVSKEELLKKAMVWREVAEKLHKFYRGKLMVLPKCAIESYDDFAWVYTPGVAQPCRIIREDPEAVWDYTNRWNYAAVVSDGSRVLGLGNIGPEAGLPVMEGKAVLFKYLGGVDAFPLVTRASTADELVQFLKWIEPNFGAINLEDIEKPKCFEVLERARNELQICVWHDDQQGTATVVYAGLKNALKVVGKKLSEAKIVFLGFGSANKKTADVLLLAGAKPENMYIVDSKGLLGPHRKDVVGTYKEWWALHTNSDHREGGLDEALKGADVLIAMSRPGPGVVKPEQIKLMNDDAIVFTCANPIPEIWPWEAKEAGARIVATGRSDFPNQINNSLGFPAIFRGVLDVMAKTVTDEMCIAAGDALAKFAEERGIHENYIVPRMDEPEVFPYEAAAAAMQAVKQGVARRPTTWKEEYERAKQIIEESQAMLDLLIKHGLIKHIPEEIKAIYMKKKEQK